MYLHWMLLLVLDDDDYDDDVVGGVGGLTKTIIEKIQQRFPSMVGWGGGSPSPPHLFANQLRKTLAGFGQETYAPCRTHALPAGVKA